MTSDISVDVPAASWGPLLRDPCGRGAPELGAGTQHDFKRQKRWKTKNFLLLIHTWIHLGFFT